MLNWYYSMRRTFVSLCLCIFGAKGAIQICYYYYHYYSEDLVFYRVSFLSVVWDWFLILFSVSSSNILIILHGVLLIVKPAICSCYWCCSVDVHRCLIFTDCFCLPFVSWLLGICIWLNLEFAVICTWCECDLWNHMYCGGQYLGDVLVQQ